MTAALSDYLLFQCRYINILTYLLTYLHQEFYQPLNVAYIDIKAAFDSVDRAALWKAVRSSGAPPFLIQLTEHLHTGTTSRVRVGGQLSEPFETTSGVRQGCVLAPALFCIAIDWILSSCTDITGTTVGSSKFTDQDYADDAVLFVGGDSPFLVTCGDYRKRQIYFLTALLSGRIHPVKLR